MALERYSDDARRAVEGATREARELGHGQVGTEHLLLGLLGEPESTAARALAAGGASLALCRDKVIEALARRPPLGRVAPGQQLPLSDRAARTLDRAGRLAPRMGSEQVLSEHLLASLLDVEGTAGQVLRGQSVDLAAVRHALAAADEPAEAPIQEPAEPVVTGPVCGRCGASLVGSLARARIHSVDAIVFYCSQCGTALGATAGATRRQ
ncbi:MAG TPA: Clp protease N-terminal domain-containing protein [Acidimicrobiales bacterium]|jgi:ATP-dependent Clp protease ATP-binding subunit ClpC|nr:Clp protease N-terminal domain-containing protein [Acidimicrobiales bacterium]